MPILRENYSHSIFRHCWCICLAGNPYISRVGPTYWIDTLTLLLGLRIEKVAIVTSQDFLVFRQCQLYYRINLPLFIKLIKEETNFHSFIDLLNQNLQEKQYITKCNSNLYLHRNKINHP